MENQLIEKMDKAIAGIEEIKKSNEEIKLSIVKLEAKVEGLDTRLANEEAISRIVMGSVAGGTMLAFVKYLFF